jgi:hypothetical protein
MIGLAVVVIMCATIIAGSKIYANTRVRLQELENQHRLSCEMTDAERTKLSLEKSRNELFLSVARGRDQLRASLVENGISPDIALRALPPLTSVPYDKE